jgi:uncharacterized protein YndB with AHSA1/START domain
MDQLNRVHIEDSASSRKRHIVQHVSDISVDVDLVHSPQEVWRALTDRRRLTTWFMQTDLEPRPGAVCHAVPGGIPGFTGPFDIEVVSVAEERLLVMRWRGDQLHSEVRWELEEIDGGTRLRVSQSGFLGVNGTLRRRELRRAYQRIFGEELPAMLDAAAQGEAAAAISRQRAEQQLIGVGQVSAAAHHVENELPSAAPPPSVDPSGLQDPSDPWAQSDPSVSVGVALPKIGVDEESSEPLPPPHGLVSRLAAAFPLPDRVRAVAVTVTVAMIVATVGWLWLTRPVHTDTPAGPVQAETHEPGFGELPTPQSALPTVSVAPSGSVGPGGVVLPGGSTGPGQSGGPTAQPSTEATESGAPAVQPALTAEYSTQSSTGLLGYQVSVTVTVHNPGTSSHSGWTVILTTPDGATVDSSSSSVEAAKSGTEVTVTPKEPSKVVNAGSDVVFTLTFSGRSLLGIGSGGVTGCTIDGAECTKAGLAPTVA